MPSAHVVVETPVHDSFRVSAMRGMYDVSPEKKLRHEWDVELPIDDWEWNIGLVVGSSGSGKTTIARHVWGNGVFHKGFKWDPRASVLDGFPSKMNIRDIVNLLCHVGFSSPPSWAKPFHVLSNGQKFRVELARVLADGRPLTVVDEFTSVVDRTAAKVGSYAVAKTARRTGKRLVLLSCHRDIAEWLEPDWIYDIDSMTFARGELQRPKIELRFFQVHRSAWRMFQQHHYLRRKLRRRLNASWRCWVIPWLGSLRTSIRPGTKESSVFIDRWSSLIFKDSASAFA
jgi:ABC-type Mn2+/Zn2+ transport system ATPase subunit